MSPSPRRRSGRQRLGRLRSLAAILAAASTALAAPSALAASGAAHGTPAGLDGLELCSPVHWRAHRGGLDPATCALDPSPEELASEGGVVLLGSLWDVSHRTTAVPREPRCGGPYEHASNAAFIRQVRAARSDAAPPIAFVHLQRFDLVPLTFAALEGFDAGFLVPTARPWSALLEFFASDTSGVCASGGCRWSDSYWGRPEWDEGPRLRDRIDASGGEGAYRKVVYYLARSQPGRAVYWPRAALGNLSRAGYRSWRVAEARRALEVGELDAVMLNEKLSQYARRGGHWIGGELAPDVAHLNAERRTLWTAPPDGYGREEYLDGWRALGRELRAAGVPYVVRMSARVFEASADARLREATLDADVALVHGLVTPAQAERIDGQMRARGGRAVLMGPARALCGVGAAAAPAPAPPAPPASPITLDFVAVGAPGNPGDAQRTRCCNHRVVDGRSSGFGAVATGYRITRSVVTVDQWVTFLNAVAREDPHGLWSESMERGPHPCILREGASGSYSYRALEGEGPTPIRFITFFDALRFVNWLHNGQPRGGADASSTEDGAYALRGGNPAGVRRSAGARYWLPDEDEWYKAAYYDPARGYLRFGYGDEPLPEGATPERATQAHQANLCPPTAKVAKPCPILGGPGRPTPVCAYPGRSPWGLCDTVGNAIEMTETRETTSESWGEGGQPAAVIRGGHFKRGWQDSASEGRNFLPLDQGDRCFACAFRVAAPPE